MGRVFARQRRNVGFPLTSGANTGQSWASTVRIHHHHQIGKAFRLWNTLEFWFWVNMYFFAEKYLPCELSPPLGWVATVERLIAALSPSLLPALQEILNGQGCNICNCAIFMLMYCRVNEVEHVLKMKHLSSWRYVPIRYFSVQSESAKHLLDKLH